MKSKFVKGTGLFIMLITASFIIQSYKTPASIVKANIGNAYVQMFGHVTLVQAYEVSGYRGFHALVTLKDKPGVTVAILSTSDRFLSVCETALTTGNLLGFWGQKMSVAPAPLGGTWSVDVYEANSILVYNVK